jgi:hypothetical protein
MSGAKGSLIGAASGAATAAVSGYASTAIPFLTSGGWWAMPAALLLVGHFLKRKNPTIGGAILGIAGYQAYANFLAAKASAPSAKGFIDAGAFAYGDAGILNSPSDVTRYQDNPGTVSSLQTQSGQNMGTDAGMLVNHETMGWTDAGELVESSVMGLET